MPLPESEWVPALKRVRDPLKLLARQRLPRSIWRKVDPSDVVQITLAEADEKRAQFKGSSESQLLPWLRPMLLHRLYDEIRRCRAEKRGKGKVVSPDGVFGDASTRVGKEILVAATTPSKV